MPKTLAVLLPGANDHPATSPATPDVLNGVTVLDYDAAADEAAIWLTALNQAYAGGAVTAEVYFTMSSATSGDVRLGVSVEAIADAESATADSFDTENLLTVTVPAVAGTLKKASITLTTKDVMAVGERVRFRVRRLGADAADTATGDLELHLVEIVEA